MSDAVLIPVPDKEQVDDLGAGEAVSPTSTPITVADLAAGLGEIQQPRITVRTALKKLAEGELGSLRVLLVIALIWTIFALSHDRFLSPENLTNLLLQITAVGTISIGVVLVLLLGEIDLSVGAVSGLAAAVMATLSAKLGWPAVPAILAGLGTGALIGLFQGTIATRLGIPTFVVTLAGLMGWQGVLLAVLGKTGTINVTDPAITGLAGTFLPAVVGWAVAVVCIGALAASALLDRKRRLAAALPAERLSFAIARVGAVTAVIITGVLIVNTDRGVPLVVLILIALVAGFSALATRSRFGRYLFAVGGNAEASRRAGIKVNRVRTVVFVLASTMAAAGGILAASRLLAVNQSSGGGDLLLLAIAGPVIAGVSLFGGRGTIWAALLGALVIGSISNGMDLLAFESSVKFMVTGAVLLVAVSLDALSRRRRMAHGKV